MQTNGISPGGPHPLPPVLRSASAPPASSPWGADSVEPARPPAFDVRDAARALLDGEGLKKAEVSYRFAEGAAAPDGSLYLLYTESPRGPRGYLARVTPEGRLAWELPLEEEGLRDLGTTPDGGARVGSEKGTMVVDGEGRILRVEPGSRDVRERWTDGAGVRYELLRDRHLRAFDARGAEAALPEGIRDLEISSGATTPEGRLVLRSDRQVFVLAPGGALESAHELPEMPPRGDTTHRVQDTWPLDDGGLMLRKESTTVVPGAYHDWHPGGHMGPLMDPIPVTTSQNRLVRLGPDGAVRWESENLGSSPRVAVLPDGTAYAGSPARGRSGVDFQRLRPEDGHLEKGFSAEGPVHEFLAEPGGTLLAGHGGVWTRYSPEGRVLAEASTQPDHGGSRFVSGLPDGRLLFRDADGRGASACRLETGDWTPLTDPSGDHSMLLAARQRAEEGPAPQVEAREEWVVIGDVTLPRQGRADGAPG